MFMTQEKAAELAELGVGSFDDPAAFVASQPSAIFITPGLTVLAIRHRSASAGHAETEDAT
jgi:hypothetical protein